MKNTELVKIAEETMNKLFAGRKDIEIKICSKRHNGVAIMPFHIGKEKGLNGYEYTFRNAIGFGVTVYAIAGADNVINKINKAYSHLAENYKL